MPSSLTRMLVRLLLLNKCCTLVELFVLPVQLKLRNLDNLLLVTGWKLKRNVEFLLQVLLCSSTIVTRISTFWILQDTKISLKILIVLWWRSMRLSWLSILLKVSSLKLRSYSRLLKNVVFLFLLSWISLIVMDVTH